MSLLDPRFHAVRPDLADIALQGRVEAPRFAHGALFRVAAPQAPLRRSASPDSTLLTEALCGEEVAVFDTTAEGWAWGQLRRDRYVGWIPSDALSRDGPAPTQKVRALRTFAFAGPDIKQPPLAALPLGAEVAVTGEAEDKNARYSLISPAGAVVVQHLAPLDAVVADWVAVAEMFLGTPYLWGGKTSLGIDCSGLVQVALGEAGTAAPRDTDVQEAALGKALALGSGLPALRRGDLLFWKGHVGIMSDAENLLHANAHHMAVAVEPLRTTLDRYARRGIEVTSIRRIEEE